MSELSLSPEQRERNAAERDCHIVYPAQNEIQIDIGNEADARFATEAIPELIKLEEAHGRRVEVKITPSPSGEPFHNHITLTWTSGGRSFDYADQVRIAFQACLGSDRKREFLNLLRTIDRQPKPCCFFEKNTPESFDAEVLDPTLPKF